MTVCPACGTESECVYRCDGCGRDLVDDEDVATDGGIPLAGGQDDTEYYVVDEDRATVVAGPFDSGRGARADAKERAPGHIVTTGRVLKMHPERFDRKSPTKTVSVDVDVGDLGVDDA